MQIAAGNGDTDTIRFLLGHGADINLNGGRCRNALQIAVVNNELFCVDLLLSNGAEVDPPGQQWEELLATIRKEYNGPKKVEALRRFQRDPNGYAAMRKGEIAEGEKRDREA